MYLNCNTVGIDLAKNVFQLHAENAKGKALVKKRIKRENLMQEIIKFPTSCTIAMEACGSANYWGRKFEQYGYEVRLYPPQYVKPFVRTNKNDRNDAAGICITATRPDINYTKPKTIEQQDMKLLHVARESFVKQKIEISNRIRGILQEYGIVFPKGIHNLKINLWQILEDADIPLTILAREVINDLYEQFKATEKILAVYTKKLETMSKENELCKNLLHIPGIGPIVSTAIISHIGNGKQFKKGRNLSAYLGLVPRQNSSGEKKQLLKISKKGDTYIRKQLVQSGRVLVISTKNKKDKLSKWIQNLERTKGFNKASVAVANKLARVIWGVLNIGEFKKELMGIGIN